MNAARRSYERELLDEPSIPFADIRQNMEELNFINKWLGGHQITIAGFKKVVGDKKRVSICEIGCGGGDNLAAIDNWCRKKKIALTLMGIDIKKECIAFAKTRNNFSSDPCWMVSDYKEVVFERKPDIIFSSLFCHHFNEEELVFQFRWMRENAAIGFFVNDLNRHFLAYHSIKLLTKLFSKSYLVKNDAPVSVTRGFKHAELRDICKAAEIPGAEILWKWAFRFLVISTT
jgi:2-polyprenyl-3-methyl-5-hydroxy-6-metoxy-1,4-benzoquinol methylase